MTASLPPRHGQLALRLKRLCDVRGAQIAFWDDWGQHGEITFPSGRKSRFKGAGFDINGAASAAIARDKDHTACRLSACGVASVPGLVVLSPRYHARMTAGGTGLPPDAEVDAALHAAVAHFGLPLYVKPNDGAEGDGVARVTTMETLRAHVTALHARYDHVLIQPPIAGRDIRLVMLDGRCLLAYERRPLTVTGDGKSSLAALMEVAVGPLQRADELRAEISTAWAREGIAPETVLPHGARSILLANANLTTGGTAVDVTDSLAAGYIDAAAKACAAIGLRFAGVDLLTQTPEAYSENHAILELNHAPGLRYFAGVSPENDQKVDAVFRALLDAMDG